MSKVKEIDVTCPYCMAEGTFHYWQSINVTTNPELKSSVLDGSIFQYICKECQGGVDVRTTYLYHDMDLRLMVYLIPDTTENKSIAEVREEFLLTGVVDSLPEQYITRLVTDFRGLQEKILLFDNGLDDKIIEMLKFQARITLQEEIENIFDYRILLRNITPEGDLEMAVLLSEDVRVFGLSATQYDKCAADFGIAPEFAEIYTKEFPIIDDIWISDILNIQQGENLM
jgi:hypothetical protein